jgi:integrase
MTVRKRGKFWHYQFMIAGALQDAGSKKDALAMEAAEQVKVRRGDRAPANGLDRFQTFVDDVYMKYSKENKASWIHDEFRCKMLCEHFGNKRFTEITSMQVVAFIKQRLASKVKRHRQKSEPTRLRSAVTVHKEVTLLSSIFLMAMREKVAAENPVATIPKTIRKMLKGRRRRQCPLDDLKEHVLIEKGFVGRNAHLRPVVLFDLHTGLRLGELERLERDHVNLDRESKWVDIDGEPVEVPVDCFVVVKSKNGSSRVIPLNSQAKAIVQHQLSDVTVGNYVFPSAKHEGEIMKEVKKGFASACNAPACKEAGLKYGLYESNGITFHTLRHRFNSKLEGLGVTKAVRRDLMGHTPTDITDDYTHSTIDQRRRAVELLCHNQTENVVKFPADCGKTVAAA